MVEIINKDWLSHFLKEFKTANEVYIISPFITNTMTSHLIKNYKGQDVKVITRFNLSNFKSGVSNLSGLKNLVEIGVKIIGIKELHSKAYIFDNNSAIITSANFTSGGFFNNFELGIKTSDSTNVNQTVDYFNMLWNYSNEYLDLKTIVNWQKEISTYRSAKTVSMPDYGKSIARKTIGNKKHFIKFYGRGNERASLNDDVKNLIQGTHCHFAVTFSDKNGRPRRYKDGDIVYLARMVEGQGYAIFGKSIAIEHNDKRDVASKKDIDKISWKKDYPIYIRIKSPEFINSKLKDCPEMLNLIEELKHDCFARTKWRNLNGEENINPKLSLKRKPDVILSEEGALWVENRFQEAISKHGKVPDAFLNSLYQG